MLLRRFTEHVTEQNWTAIIIDFVIVVVGVFIGMQVSNWNEERSARDHERRLLHELRSEIALNAERSRLLGEGLITGADAARRILELAKIGGAPCTDDCWFVVVDLMHASQWQLPQVSWTTYEELRRVGLPTERSVIEAVERYKSISDRSSTGLVAPPEFRTLVRRLIPIRLQDQYWENCFVETGISEIYVFPCARPNTAESIDPQDIREILEADGLAAALREWTSIARMSGRSLTTNLQTEALESLTAIDRVIDRNE